MLRILNYYNLKPYNQVANNKEEHRNKQRVLKIIWTFSIQELWVISLHLYCCFFTMTSWTAGDLLSCIHARISFEYISPLHSKPHKWLRRAFVRKIPTRETTHFKCNIKQSARLSQRILYNEARECTWNSRQPFRTLRIIILQKVRVVCVCMRNWKQTAYGGF